MEGEASRQIIMAAVLCTGLVEALCLTHLTLATRRVLESPHRPQETEGAQRRRAEVPCPAARSTSRGQRGKWREALQLGRPLCREEHLASHTGLKCGAAARRRA
ncbi:hypothetical protein NDU88_001976 [Pleurodeles waltl]|uniref:Uncharacterized protein n=1 Tax=Pleurodeles waltl TaxID=8319 RepID=A0AAV7M9P6_PLEWA|nr:hypothetical protein NDU88_001976 [Pleurodeles waltl]